MKNKPGSTWHRWGDLKRKHLTADQIAEVDRYVMQDLLKMERRSPGKFSNNMPNSIGRILKDLTEGMWIVPRTSSARKAPAKIKHKLCRQEALLLGTIWLSVRASLYTFDLSWMDDLPPRQRKKCQSELAQAARKTLWTNFNKLREGLRLPIFMKDMEEVYYSWRSTARIHADPKLAQELKRSLSGETRRIPRP